MPLVIDRRVFLQAALGSAAFAQKRERTRWALLSDTHVPANQDEEYRGFRPAANLKRVIPRLLAYAPDGALISGDIARLVGAREDYDAVKALLEPLTLRMTVTLAMGNHDDRDNFFAVFSGAGESPLKGRHIAVVDASPLRFVVLDSLIKLPVVSGKPAADIAGLLGKAQRTWLERFLASPDATPTIVFVHHPPDDSDNNLLDSDRLLQLVAPARKVKAIVYGHSHVYSYDQVNGIHLINIPAMGYNFTDAAPVGWVEAAMTRQGADLTLRVIGGNAAQDGATKSLEWRS
jgi:3',5'-cyclic AMP phosphodiesterase CpdA